MKKLTLSLAVFSTMFMMSCGETKEETKKEETKVETPAAINGEFKTAEGATVTWKAKHNKDADWVHVGTIPTTGSVAVMENMVSTGSFAFDITKLNEGDSDMNEMLEKHLQDSTLLNSALYPTANFAISTISEGKVSGILTFVGVSVDVTFDAAVTVAAEGVSVKGSIPLDLSAFNIPYVMMGLALPEDQKADAIAKDIMVDVDLTLVP